MTGTQAFVLGNHSLVAIRLAKSAATPRSLQIYKSSTPHQQYTTEPQLIRNRLYDDENNRILTCDVFASSF